MDIIEWIILRLFTQQQEHEPRYQAPIPGDSESTAWTEDDLDDIYSNSDSD